jgi:L,D-transpeptidase YcbB
MRRCRPTRAVAASVAGVGLIVVSLLPAGCLSASHRPRPLGWSELTGLAIRARIRGIHGSAQLLLSGSMPMAAAPQLSRFYRRRGGRPAWCGPSGPRRRADDLIAALEDIHLDGLSAQDYGLRELASRVARWRADPGAPEGAATDFLAEIDLLLTNAFLLCAGDLQRGRVPPQQIHAGWQASPRRTDLGGLLQSALDLDRVQSALAGLRPPQPGYALLRRALAQYRGIQNSGGWPLERTWRDQGRLTRHRLLARRLTLSGDIPEMDAPVSAAQLREGVVRFQRRHGLETTGALGPLTRAELDVPVADRIAQIEASMERWRWLPHDPGAHYVLVRLADFELDAVADGQTQLRLRVIVGRPFWRTPIFSSQITRLELNPPWYIPQSIAVAEILPRLQQDSTYLQAHSIDVIPSTGDTPQAVAAAPIDWSAVDAAGFDYRLRQRPGPGNPLGRVKFYFPNESNVYLHDTPNEALFQRRVRDLSHGCIRVERSLALAAFVLGDGWGTGRLEALADGGEHRSIELPEPMPVYLLYWTAWLDEDAGMQFRQDWYDADLRLRRALHGPRQQSRQQGRQSGG